MISVAAADSTERNQIRIRLGGEVSRLRPDDDDLQQQQKHPKGRDDFAY